MSLMLHKYLKGFYIAFGGKDVSKDKFFILFAQGNHMNKQRNYNLTNSVWKKNILFN